MIAQILEIQSPGKYLKVKRGRIYVFEGENELGSVPTDDVAVLLISDSACTISGKVIARLLANGSTIVFTGENFLPAGVLLPCNNTITHGTRLRTQIGAGEVIRQLLWAQVVKSKISNQAALIESCCGQGKVIRSLLKKVKRGDPENIEAQAARRYWILLFGPDFRRDRTAEGINSLLNYGYTILRAATARSIIAAGLHPSLSIHHSNGQNPFALVDDLMEPFRPLVDYVVKQLVSFGQDHISPDTKKELSGILHMDLYDGEEKSTLASMLNVYCMSYVRSLEANKCELSPLDFLKIFDDVLNPGNEFE